MILTALHRADVGAYQHYGIRRSPSASSAPQQAPRPRPRARRPRPRPRRPAQRPEPDPNATLAPNQAEQIIAGVEPNGEVSFCNLLLSATFNQYIEKTIGRSRRRIRRQGELGRRQAISRTTSRPTRGRQRARRDRPVGLRGLGLRLREQGLLLDLDSVPQAVKGIDLRVLERGADQRQDVESRGTRATRPSSSTKSPTMVAAGLASARILPKTFDGRPSRCQMLKDKADTVRELRLTVNELLSQTNDEGNVKVRDDHEKSFMFDPPEAVEWLQTYVDMVKAGNVERNTAFGTMQVMNPRRGADLSSGQVRSEHPDRTPDPRKSSSNNSYLDGDSGCCACFWVGAPGVALQGDEGDLRQRRHEVLPQARLIGARAVLHSPAKKDWLCSPAGRRSTCCRGWAYDGTAPLNVVLGDRGLPGSYSPRSSNQGTPTSCRRSEQGRRQRDRPQGGRAARFNVVPAQQASRTPSPRRTSFSSRSEPRFPRPGFGPAGPPPFRGGGPAPSPHGTTEPDRAAMIWKP